MRRPTRSALAGAIAAIAIVTLLPSVAEAHDPIIVDDSQTTPDAGPLLPDGTISFALYGVVGGPGDTRGFRVRFADGDRLVVSLLVPDLPPEQALEPDLLPTLTVDGPDGSSREFEPDTRVAFDEPFSGTRYLRLLEIDEAAAAGEYAITVVGRAPARFTVSVGTIERFGTPVEDVVDRDAGVGGVQAWYGTPPPDAAIEPPATTAPEATSAPRGPVGTAASSTTTTATTTTTTTTQPTVTAPPSTSVPPVDDGSGPEPNGVVTSLIAAVVAAAVIGGAVLLVRRNRPG